MNTHPLAFTISLTSAVHQRALEFYKQHDRAAKAKQVYLNTLAVSAVQMYLNYLGIETNLQGSDSQNIVLQMLSDCADLEVKDWGKLECRPVLPDVSHCHVPPEVWGDRKGYIAVQFNRELTEAKLLGFLATINEAEVSCDRWQSLEQLITTIGESTELSQQKTTISLPKMNKTKAKLSHWLRGAIDAGWQTLEELRLPPSPELAFNFRGKVNAIPAAKTTVKRGKYLNLQRENERIALLVGLVPTTNSEMDVSVEVYPIGSQTNLPQDLQLIILDEEGEMVMQANARKTANLQLEFSGEVGDCFNVKLALEDFSLMELFEI